MPLFTRLQLLVMSAATLTGTTVTLANSAATIHRANSEKMQFATIQEAIDAAVAGDRILIKPGTHEEVLKIHSKHGTATSPIILESEAQPSAIIEGGDPSFFRVPNRRWTQLDGRLWEATATWTGNPERANLCWISGEDGRLFHAFKKENLFLQSTLDDSSIRVGNRVLIRMGEGEDPNQQRLFIGKSEAVIAISDSSYWKIRSLTVRHGGNCNILIGPNTCHLLIQEVVLQNAWRGIGTDGDPASIHNIEIRDSKILAAWPGTREWCEAYQDAGGSNDDFSAPMRGTALFFSGYDSVIRGNTLAGGWDGMGVRGQDIRVYGNKVSDFQDDGIELESGVSSNIFVYENTLFNVFVGMSLVSQSPGPLYIYRNRVSSNRLIPFNHAKGNATRFGYALKMGTDWGPGARNVAIYHNTFYSKRLNLWDKEQTAWEDFSFINNIFVSEGIRSPDDEPEEFQIWNTGLAEKGVFWGGNLYHRIGGGGILFRKWNGTMNIPTLTDARTLFSSWEQGGQQADPRFRYINTTIGGENSFELSPESSARNAGIPIPSHFPDSVPVVDGKRDVGALEETQVTEVVSPTPSN